MLPTTKTVDFSSKTEICIQDTERYLLLICPTLYQHLHHPGCRYCQQHAGQAEEITADADGEQYEEWMESGGTAHNPRINVIAVQLLYEEERENRGNGFCQAIGEKGHEKGGNHADKWTEVGDNIQQAAYDSDDHGEVHLQHGQNGRG